MNRKLDESSEQDSPTKLSDFRVAVASSLIGLFGVLIGSAIAGYFAVRSQSMMMDQQRYQLSRQVAVDERQELRRILRQYLGTVRKYADLRDASTLKSSDIDDFDRNAWNSAIEISLLFSSNLGAQTFELNRAFSRNLRAILSNPSMDKKQLNVQKEIIGWLLIAEGELTTPHYSNDSDATRDLLTREFREGKP